MHAEHPEHHTRKSHASLERDRLKHSGKVNAARHGVPRKHGFGKGNVGVPGEEYEADEMPLDPKDPDYEDDEEAGKEPVAVEKEKEMDVGNRSENKAASS